MKFSYTTSFKRSYRKLNPQGQSRIDTALRKLAETPHHPFHPGLSVHKLGGVLGTATKPGQSAPEVWEMHATDAFLVTFQYGEDEILLRNCGQHDQVLRSP